MPPFGVIHLKKSIAEEPFVKRLSRHILTAKPFRYSTFRLTTDYDLLSCKFFIVC